MTDQPVIINMPPAYQPQRGGMDPTTALLVVGGVAAIGIGAWYFLKKKKGDVPAGDKEIGQEVGATITFSAKGIGRLKVGFGLGIHAALSNSDLHSMNLGNGLYATYDLHQFFTTMVDVDSDTMKEYTATVKGILQAPPKQDVTLDALVFVQTENGELDSKFPYDGYLATQGYEEVYRVTPTT